MEINDHIMDTMCFPLIIRTITYDAVTSETFNHSGLASLSWKRSKDMKYHHAPVCSSFLQFDEESTFRGIEIIHTIPNILFKNAGKKELSDSHCVRLHVLWQSLLPENYDAVVKDMDNCQYSYTINPKVGIIMEVGEDGIRYNPVKFDI